MSVTNPMKSQNQYHFLPKNVASYVVYATVALLLCVVYFSPFSLPDQSTADDQFSSLSTISAVSSASASPPAAEQPSKNEVLQEEKRHEEPPSENEVLQEEMKNEEPTIENEVVQEEKTHEEPQSENEVLQEEKRHEEPPTCDYGSGNWIQDTKGPLYNGSSCGTIKDGQNCMSHERPDTDYLHWKWKPSQCDVSRFDPQSFLQILQGKHLAFIGDSLARNQLESLLCMLSSVSPPNLVYSNGDDNKFRRWHFPSHNANVSVYWSPFLVKGVEKSHDKDYNKLYLDAVDERWASDLESIDMVVLSIGQWFLLRAVYYEGNVELGCHGLEGINCTDIEYYGVFGKALNTTLKTIIQRKGLQGKGIDVVVTTFSPHHFDGDWDKFGACNKTKPYKEEEKALDGMNANMRQVAVEQVEKAKVMLNADSNRWPNVNVAALDVTKLSLLRPDGHPGPYMYPFPFADGVKERVHNDCVHWCLPGPIDTWNEIMLDIVKRWHTSTL